MVQGLTYRDAATRRVLTPEARAALPAGATTDALRASGVDVAWETMSKCAQRAPPPFLPSAR